MISVFDTQPVILEEKDGHVLTVSRNGLLYKDSNGEVLKDVDFEDVNGIMPSRYLNSNSSYTLIFRGRNWKNMASELDTDRYNTSGGHNIRETKAIITAFARHKLTDDFPDNLDTLDLPLDYSYFKKRETRLSGGVITNGKKEIPIHDIRRVKCVTNGTISNLCIYTTDKGRFFFDMPKMTVTLNALTVPLLEAVMTRNTGHGIDFSRGDGFEQKTSEFVIIRYLDSGYFLHKDGTAHEDWKKTACDRTAGYGYDLKMLMQE